MQLRNGNNSSRTVNKRIVRFNNRVSRTNHYGIKRGQRVYINVEYAGEYSLSPITILGLIINRQNMTIPFKNWKGQH